VRAYLHISILSLGLTVLGCGDYSSHKQLSKSPEPSARVDKVTLLSMPAPMNMDHTSGADGIRVQVWMFRRSSPEPVLTNGTLQFLLFEQSIQARQLQSLKPFLRWTFSGDKLDRHCVRSRYGWGYQADLKWGDKLPRSNVVSLAVAHRSADGRRMLYSEPVVIPLRR